MAYGPSPGENGMLSPRVTRESIFFENTSGHTLTNVTVYVEFVYFTSVPEPMAFRVLHAGHSRQVRHVYSQEPGQNYFSRAYREGHEGRPASADRYALQKMPGSGHLEDLLRCG